MNVPASVVEDLLLTWEDQQSNHIRFREERFTIMFDFAREALGDDIRLIDIASGPGSLSRRGLYRFPALKAALVDYDPVLLHLAKENVKRYAERADVIEGDLRGSSWKEALPAGEFDCAMSTTALHWLSSGELMGLYRNVFEKLKKGGVMINGDHMLTTGRNQGIFELIRSANRNWSKHSFEQSGAPDWDAWWENVRKSGFFEELLNERAKRYPNPDNHNQLVPYETHVEYLRKAGFRQVDTIWQYSGDRILVGIK